MGRLSWPLQHRGRSKSIHVSGAILTPLGCNACVTLATRPSSTASPLAKSKTEPDLAFHRAHSAAGSIHSGNGFCSSDSDSSCSSVDIRIVGTGSWSATWPNYWEGGDPTGLGRWTERD